VRLAGIFFLGVNHGLADLDGGEFVPANSAVKDFLLSRGGVLKYQRLSFCARGMGNGQFAAPT